MCFLAARSAREMAVIIFFLVLSLLAILIAALRFIRIRLLTSSFRFEPLSALLAVFVTGIINSESQNTLSFQILWFPSIIRQV